jgi:hypothetical protein
MRVGLLSGNAPARLRDAAMFSSSAPLVSGGKFIALRPAALSLVEFGAAPPTAAISSRLKGGLIIATASALTADAKLG